jgi:hypothetical protein
VKVYPCLAEHRGQDILKVIMSQKFRNLDQLFDRICEGADAGGGEVSLEEILEKVGRRSFGPLLLLAGLVTLAPIIGDIPGVPTIMVIFVLLTAGQMTFHKEYIWLPDWLLNRSVEQDNIHKAVEWLRPPAQFFDRWLRSRLTMFLRGVGAHLIAIVCIIIALAMPFMEVVPFSANGAGIALTAFGLSLITRDGLVALLALLVAIGTIGVIIYNLF